MSKASTEARILFPYLLPMLQRALSGNGNGSSGSAGIGGAPSPHTLSGSHHTGTLANSQAPQFLLVDGSRKLTGHLAVNAGITIDGVDLGALKGLYDIHVADPDAHHARATAGNGLSITGQQLAVNQGFAFSWTGIHSFNQDIQLDADLDFVGSQQITTSAGNLTLNPFADLILPSTKTDRSSDYADGIPIAGYSFHVNSGSHRQLTTHTIKADELHVRAFIADTVRVDIGEEYWGKSMGIVYADFTTPGSIGGTVTATFEDSVALTGAVFANNDWLMISTVDIGTGLEVNQIWGQVSGYTDLGADANGVGRQSWTFTLRSGLTSWPVKKGRLAVDFGASGQGYVHLSTLDSADGPWIQIGTWAGANPYTAGNRTIRTQIGKLTNISDPDFSPTGFGLYSENAYLKGIVRTAETVMDDDGLSTLLPSVASPTDPGAHARFSWWADVDIRVGTAPARVAAWRDTTGPEANILQLQATDGALADAGIVWLQAVGVSSSVLIVDSRGVISLKATTIDAQGHLKPHTDSTYDLGSASLKWRTLYVDLLSATTISGTSLSGQTWTYPASMTIDAVSASNTLVSVANSGAGRADFDVDRNITLGGTIDGVDLSGHVASASAHHDPVTAGSGISLSTQVVSVDSTVARTSTQTIAGAGLTGGGTLAADRTLDVVALSTGGLQVNANDVQIKLPATSGLQTDATGLWLKLAANSALALAAGGVSVDSAIAGAGLTFTTGVLAVVSGNGAIVVGADAITLTLASNSGLNVTSGLAVDSSIAGAGMTMTTGALNVIALSTGGLTVNANDLQIKLPAASGLTTDATGLYVADAMAGAGLVIASKILAVGAGTGISVAADSVAVDQAFSPTWTGSHTWNTGVFTFNTDPQIGGDIDLIGASRQITTASTFDLSVVTGGDIILNPTGTDVLPGGSIAIDLGDYNRKWRTIFAAEMYVETIVAADVLATVGGQIMVAPTTSLLADINTSATTITVKHNGVLAVNGFLIMQTAPGGVVQFEAMKVTASLGAGGGGYQYTVVRNQDGTGANSWVAGDAVVYTGNTAGQGYINLAAVTTVHNHIGPTITIYSRSATTNWNDIVPVVTMGNLDSFLGYGVEYGFAVGNNLTLTPSTGFSGLSADRTNGIRMYNVAGQFYSGSTLLMTLDGNGLGLSGDPAFSNSLSWWDDMAGVRDDTNRLGGISLSRNGSYNYLSINAQSLDATHNKGAISLVAYSYALGTSPMLFMDESGLYISPSTSFPPSTGLWTDGNDVTLDGTLAADGAISAPVFRSGALNINDDSVYTFTPPFTTGVLLLTNTLATAAVTALIVFRTVATLTCQNVVAGSTINVAIGTYTGTTGTDGKATVAVHGSNGTIQIENRLGGTSAFRWTVFG